ncbi:hypothetical protein [Paenibacillus taichungensis]|uniref:hypothetical protein n=1 Tax=Paenibacillus taichungensis TaxID=484184 RepID=UPI0035E35015
MIRNMEALHDYLYERFSSIEELEFMDTDHFKYYVGNDPGMDEPVQVKIDRKSMKIYYRSPADDTWIEEQMDAPAFADTPKPEHRELMEMIADKLKVIFIAGDVWHDATIFFNGQAYKSGQAEADEYVNPTDYVAYCNPETVTVTYEGRLNRAMNEGEYNPDTGLTDWTVYVNAQKMLESYGYYFSLINNFSFTIYPI